MRIPQHAKLPAEVITQEIEKAEGVLKTLIEASPEFCLVFMNAIISIQNWVYMQDMQGVSSKIEFQSPMHIARLTGQLDFINYLAEIRDALEEANKEEDGDNG